MAIQAQVYAESSGFATVDWGGGGGGGGAVGMSDEMCMMNLQRQQMLQFQNRILQQRSNINNTSSFGGSESLGSIVEKQSLEMDHYIRSQSERLRLVLREQRKREVVEIMKKIEARTSVLLKQKDEEIAGAANRISQLESLIIKLQNEARIWQQFARQNELHVANLRNSIQQLQHSSAGNGGVYGGVHGGDGVVEDSESCCDESGAGAGAQVVCKMCQVRERSVVLLPCRHLCCCTVCVNMIDFCPVCQTEKKATIEALFH